MGQIGDIFSSPALSKSIEAARKRNQVIGNNISNISTPGYERKEVKFREKLRNSLDMQLKGENTHSKHIDLGGKNIEDIDPEVYTPQDDNQYTGVNNVNLEEQISKMTDNRIFYQYAVKFYRGMHEKFKSAISERIR